MAGVVAGEPRRWPGEPKLRSRALVARSPQRVSLHDRDGDGRRRNRRTWTNVGRALATAEHVLAEGGAVAICSNLE